MSREGAPDVRHMRYRALLVLLVAQDCAGTAQFAGEASPHKIRELFNEKDH